MCQKKPGPRCANHVYTDLLKARSSYKEALKLFEALPVTTEKDERALAMKRAIFEKRDHEFAVSSISPSALKTARAHLIAFKMSRPQTDADKLMVDRAQEILSRFEAIKNEGRLEGYRRDRYVRKSLASYLATGGPVTGKGGLKSPRLTVDVLSLLQGLTPQEGGRELTPAEAETLERASKCQSQGSDYLQDEREAPEVTTSRVVTPLPETEPRPSQPVRAASPQARTIPPLPNRVARPVPAPSPVKAAATGNAGNNVRLSPRAVVLPQPQAQAQAAPKSTWLDRLFSRV